MSAPTPVLGRSSQQVTMPYDHGSVTTREYPSTIVPPRRAAADTRQTAVVVEDADVDVHWADSEMSAVERALTDLQVEDPVPEGDYSARIAAGSGQVATDSAIPAQLPERKRTSQSRPTLKGILGDDGEHELDVPTFIRRHSASQS